MKKYLIVLFFFFFAYSEAQIINADARTEEYFPLIKGKRVALVCNHTSVVKDRHLIEMLLDNSINVVKVFSPEHGLNGLSQAGAVVNDS
ncbi:MAG: DUF1343 domain-containing protein, partial [Bacteroidota bacterium]|nr:DUF1343 domain-containing protein [Bacteroidota bacterium]